MKTIYNLHYSLIIGTILVMVWPVVSWSENDITDSKPELTASVAPQSAEVGSIALLTLTYSLAQGGHLPKEPEIKGLEGLTTIESETSAGRIRIKLLVDRLDSWKTGPLSLTYLDKEGKAQELRADPVSIKVLSSLGQRPEEARLRPIQGIIPTKALWLRYLPWGAGLLGVLLAMAGFVWRHKKRSVHRVSAELLDPPHVQARKEIEQLEARGLFEKGQIKGFYFLFSEILRRYLGRLRDFPAVEFTTEEIALRINKDEDRKLLSLLRQADLVKFADTIPTSARKQEEVHTALSYIQETRPASETGFSTDGSRGGTTR